jgi:hypothetical protein
MSNYGSCIFQLQGFVPRSAEIKRFPIEAVEDSVRPLCARGFLYASGLFDTPELCSWYFCLILTMCVLAGCWGVLHLIYLIELTFFVLVMITVINISIFEN